MTLQKQKAIEKFVFRLREEIGDKILGIFLFGSTAKGTATEESDVDILVVYSNLEEWQLLRIISNLTFSIACEDNELIEVVTMSKEEYDNSLGHSPFLWEVLEFGKPLFSVLKGTEWKLDFREYLKLAKEYLGYARDGLKEGKFRLAIDTGYNACELLVKALILSKRETLASSHGGIVGQFGRIFIVNGELPEHFGKDLHLALDLRAKARYKPKSQLKPTEAEFVINFAEELLKIAQDKMRI